MTVQQTIAPVRKSLELNCDARTAFNFYTKNMGDWWPFRTHSIGGDKTIGVAMECEEGGRLYETLEDGTEKLWGRILHWEPGARLVHSWHVNRGPEKATEVELRFTDLEGGRCRVELEHRNWEALGDVAAETRDQYDGGWTTVLSDRFGGFVQTRVAA